MMGLLACHCSGRLASESVAGRELLAGREEEKPLI